MKALWGTVGTRKVRLVVVGALAVACPGAFALGCGGAEGAGSGGSGGGDAGSNGTGYGGMTGLAGTTGAAGGAGSTGSGGTTGSAGATGAAGMTGTAGIMGAAGAAGGGAAGASGMAGTTGAAGAVGGVGTWKVLPAAPIEARHYHSAVWTGTEMIVWGGWGANGFLSDGARYSPSTNAWTSISAQGAPAPRIGHAAVWTGTEMIIWGGQSPRLQEHTNTGAAYDPKTDTWRSLPTSGAPSARDDPGAVWTGTEMIIWGGLSTNGTNGLDGGARYNPASNSWTTQIAGGPPGKGPSPRANFVSAWTGSKMVVWGGYSNLTTYWKDGSRYDPAAGTWAAMSVAGAPSARSGAAWVWTGTSLIVVGGSTDLTTYTNTGGRYDPVSDSWVSTSSIGAETRKGAGAVWTGTRMVVWGRFNSPLVNTGEIYDPAADTWTAMSTAGAPSARRDMSTIWTGEHVIVWAATTRLCRSRMEQPSRSELGLGEAAEQDVGERRREERDRHVAVQVEERDAQARQIAGADDGVLPDRAARSRRRRREVDDAQPGHRREGAPARPRSRRAAAPR